MLALTHSTAQGQMTALRIIESKCTHVGFDTQHGTGTHDSPQDQHWRGWKHPSNYSPQSHMSPKHSGVCTLTQEDRSRVRNHLCIRGWETKQPGVSAKEKQTQMHSLQVEIQTFPRCMWPWSTDSVDKRGNESKLQQMILECNWSWLDIKICEGIY